MSFRQLEPASQSNDNNFNLIRMLCAWGVLFAHSYILSGSTQPVIDPFYYFFNIQMGTFCVMIFFAISGFLIQRSILRSSSLLSYTQARVLRLIPALFIALLFTVFALGPVLTDLSIQEYFLSQETWLYLVNLNLLDPSTRFSLPGVFQANNSTDSVNGSIWTLPFETWMYVMTAVYFVMKTAATKYISRYQPLISVLGILITSTVILGFAQHFIDSKQVVNLDILFFISTFFVGANFYNLRRYIPLSWLLLGLALATTPLLKESLIYILYLPMVVTYSVMVLAYRLNGKVRSYNKIGDYSYGLYIYAFPIQQSLVHFFQLDFIPLVLASTLLTLPVAMLSWKFIESPALKYKQRKLKSG